ncbi:MAG: protein kinase [Gemmatimonadaceae bacterium]
MPTTAEMIAGALAGRYTVEREVGSGGMAVVYLADDVKHGRQVALKVLRPELAAVIGAERFLAEIRTTASLQHPGILPLYDSGEAGTQLFYVMPFIEGESLRGLLDREKQLPVTDAVRIAREVGEALAYAHDHGVIHRDVKPENILLQAKRPIIADFGISLAVQEAAGNRITQTGMSLGTPQYMSPEQAAGERDIDGRSDQYALAVILYEMLAGEPPFSAPNAQGVIAKLMTEDPRPLQSLRKSVPPGVADAVHRALSKIPADRFSNTHEFVRALGSDGARLSGYTSVINDDGGNRRLIGVAAATLVVGALIGGVAARSMSHGVQATAGQPIRFLVEPDSGQRLAFACCGNIFAIAPDGRRLAYQAADGDSVYRVHTRDLDSIHTHSWSGTDNAREFFFSPDGQQIGFAAGRQVRALDLRSGTVRTIGTLPPDGFTGGGAWTSDNRVVYSVGNALLQAPTSGGTFEPLLRIDSTKGDLQVGGPHYVAGANAILFSVERASGEPQVRELWLSTKKTKAIGPGVTPNFVSTGGFLLVARSDGTLESRRFDPASGDTLGGATVVAKNVAMRSPVFLFAEYTAASNGTIVEVDDSRGESTASGALHFVTSAGTDELHALPFIGNRIQLPRFSPDGRRVLVLSADLRTRIGAVISYDPQRRAATKLPEPVGATAAAWTHAGDSVVYATPIPDLRIQAADGTGLPRVIAPLPGWGLILDVEPTAGGVIFAGEHDGSIKIAIVESGHVRPLLSTSAAEQSPRISPDGKHLAFTVTDGGRSKLQIASYPSLGDRIVVAEGNVSDPRWTRDGTLVYADSARHAIAVTFQGGQQFAIASRHIVGSIAPGSRGWDIDASGKRIVYATDQAGLQARRLVVTVNPPGFAKVRD